MEKNNFEKTVLKVGTVTIIWNFILTLGKIIAGFFAKSSSLVSDGVHSASDVFSTIVVMIGAKISSKAPDRDHPFGHERLESIASMILAMLLGATALLLGYNGIISIIDFVKGDIPTSNNLTYIALGFAIASIVIKFLMFVYTNNAAKRIKSTALKADAYHHLSDSLSSIGSVLGIIGMLIGGYWAILDPIACIFISIFIIKVAIDICKDAIDQVVDKAAPIEFEDEIKELVNNNEKVKGLNSLRTRQFGSKCYVELEIAVEENYTVKQGHDIANEIHDKIEETFSNVKHCVVHVDPYNEK